MAETTLFGESGRPKNKRFDANRLNTKKKKSGKYECIIFVHKGKGAKLGCILDPIGRKRRIPFVFNGYGTNSSAKDELASDFWGKGAL